MLIDYDGVRPSYERDVSFSTALRRKIFGVRDGKHPGFEIDGRPAEVTNLGETKAGIDGKEKDIQ